MTSITKIHLTIEELTGVLSKLPQEDYTRPCAALSDSTIGQHVRHIIELFQCLLNQYDGGVINYDLRERNQAIENGVEFAVLCLNVIRKDIDKPNKDLILEGECGEFRTNYNRELLYNLEHCIHHQALIKVALLSFKSIAVSDEFGVAPSSLKYRKFTQV
ncbi:MAG TPA: DinB family protein [Bacteroidia bacterium]|nr:DinB family protein [Bacteroidia bacterium]